jgi:hypothetical protein
MPTLLASRNAGVPVLRELLLDYLWRCFVGPVLFWPLIQEDVAAQHITMLSLGPTLASSAAAAPAGPSGGAHQPGTSALNGLPRAGGLLVLLGCFGDCPGEEMRHQAHGQAPPSDARCQRLLSGVTICHNRSLVRSRSLSSVTRLRCPTSKHIHEIIAPVAKNRPPVVSLHCSGARHRGSPLFAVRA